MNHHDQTLPTSGGSLRGHRQLDRHHCLHQNPSESGATQPGAVRSVRPGDLSGFNYKGSNQASLGFSNPASICHSSKLVVPEF